MSKSPRHWAVVEKDSGSIAYACTTESEASKLAFNYGMLGKKTQKFGAVKTALPLPPDASRKWSDGQPYHINDYNPTGKEKGSKA